MAGTKVPRDPNLTPELRRFLDDLSRLLDSLSTTVGTTTPAPSDASYITLGTNTTLSSERVLTAGSNISLTDAGAGSTLTVAYTGSSISRASSASVGTGTTYTISNIASHTFAILQVADLSHNSGATQSFQIELSVNNGSTWSAAMIFTETAIASSVMQTDTLFISHDGSFNYTITHDIRTTGANSPVHALGAQLNAIRLSPTGGSFDSGRANLHIF